MGGGKRRPASRVLNRPRPKSCWRSGRVEGRSVCEIVLLQRIERFAMRAESAGCRERHGGIDSDG